MKKLTVLFVLFNVFISISQNTEIASNIVEPEFPGGISAQLQFIQKNFKYPNIDLSNNVSGKVEDPLARLVSSVEVRLEQVRTHRVRCELRQSDCRPCWSHYIPLLPFLTCLVGMHTRHPEEQAPLQPGVQVR